jgi:hypothetical protein
MPLTTPGAQFLAKAATGLGSPQLFTSAPTSPNPGCYLAVGNSQTAFNIANADLLGTNFRSPATVTEASGVLSMTSTYQQNDANFDWWEWGPANAKTGGILLGRKVETASLGLKNINQVWTLNATCTFAAQ